MLFGEIDCREGLLLAVQQCKVGPSISSLFTQMSGNFSSGLSRKRLSQAALSRPQYETLADGISHTVDIYINLMLELIKVCIRYIHTFACF